MKKFKLENLECANCASKMENKIRKISGVYSADISFITKTLFIDYIQEEEERILESIQKEIIKFEPNCRVIK